MARKSPKIKDPKIYTRAVEYGVEQMNIPSRPLFGNSLRDFQSTFRIIVAKARYKILGAWK